MRQLAALAQVDHSYLARFERGEATPGRAWLRDVATALGANLVRFEHASAYPNDDTR